MSIAVSYEKTAVQTPEPTYKARLGTVLHPEFQKSKPLARLARTVSPGSVRHLASEHKRECDCQDARCCTHTHRHTRAKK